MSAKFFNNCFGIPLYSGFLTRRKYSSCGNVSLSSGLYSSMAAIEEYKPELKDTLPQDEYFRLVRKPEYKGIPKQLLKNFADIPKDATGDMFGKIYEYFLGEFALAEGQ